MATGDQNDIQGRINALMPFSWFQPTVDTIEQGIIAAAANALAFIYSILAYVRLQTRIATATDGFLDLVAQDFFGTSVVRTSGQSDASFRATIQANLFLSLGTRAGVFAVVTGLSGHGPTFGLPERPGDTGGYGVPTSGYGVAGAYGSMLLPYQFFVTVHRGSASPIPNIAGYGVSTMGYSVGSRGEYIDIVQFEGGISDAALFAAVAAVLPIGYTAWMRIEQ